MSKAVEFTTFVVKMFSKTDIVIPRENWGSERLDNLSIAIYQTKVAKLKFSYRLLISNHVIFFITHIQEF